LIAAIILVIIGAWILLLGWPLLVALFIFIVFAAIIIFLIVAALVFILAIPFFFLKKGPKAEDGSYRIEEIHSIKEDERK
jgi:maltodextrin utilization protein YvdJ